MKALHPRLGIGRLCGLFGMTRQAYYDYIRRQAQKEMETTVVVELIKGIRKVHPRMGGRKLYSLLEPDLKGQGMKIGRDRLFNIMSDNQLLIKNRRRKISTTNSYQRFRKYKNLVKGFSPYKANQLWVADITYIKTAKGFSYLFLLTDAYSRKIIGYQIARTLETCHAVKCLNQAIERDNEVKGLIHHSDRGIQYCTHEYVRLLQDKGIKISMTEDSNPQDNAIAERVNGILKEEYLREMKQVHHRELPDRIDEVIYRYNQLRPHLSCDMMTPNQAHKHEGELNRRWKNYYKRKE